MIRDQRLSQRHPGLQHSWQPQGRKRQVLQMVNGRRVLSPASEWQGPGQSFQGACKEINLSERGGMSENKTEKRKCHTSNTANVTISQTLVSDAQLAAPSQRRMYFFLKAKIRGEKSVFEWIRSRDALYIFFLDRDNGKMILMKKIHESKRYSVFMV